MLGPEAAGHVQAAAGRVARLQEYVLYVCMYIYIYKYIHIYRNIMCNHNNNDNANNNNTLLLASAYHTIHITLHYIIVCHITLWYSISYYVICYMLVYYITLSCIVLYNIIFSPPPRRRRTAPGTPRGRAPAWRARR